MKIVYCIHSLYNPGGMERVLLNKVKWLVGHPERGPFDITVVTTDQHGRPQFYPFPKEVKFVDLEINYSDDNSLPFVFKFIGYLRRRRRHKSALRTLLMSLRPDVTDCFYPGECSFVPDIADGSRKVLELHQSRLFHLQYGRKGLMGLSDRFRAARDESMVRRFDSFVVLTHEDATLWGDIPNMRVIPNAALPYPSGKVSALEEKRVIAVGRLDYQKSYDRLIEAWKKVHESAPQWRLDIYGQGEWRDMLQGMIAVNGLEGTCAINPPVKDIESKYLSSSILVMSSHYEGFPMVLIEGMSCGLPAVSFDFKCGPKDIIRNGMDGIIVEDGDMDGLASALLRLINDSELRRSMGREAREVTSRFAIDSIMEKWMSVYYD